MNILPENNLQKFMFIFLPFACGYFLSYLYRSTNAVLAPYLSSDLNLNAEQLGLITSTYFLTFDTLENSTSALETLQDMGTCRVKYAHYRIFFKIKGLNEESDYNNVKSSHSKWISNETDANVLYYKLYKNRNTDEWLGSGDFTIDTKEAFDKLLSREDDGKHEYSQEGVSCRHFRYNRQSRNRPRNMTSS